MPSAAAQRRTATASLLELHAPPHRHPPANHSACAGDRPWLGRAITCHSAGAMLSRYPQRPAPGSIPAQADAGRGLLHARALLPGTPCQLPLQPAALAPSVHCSPHAFSLTWYCALLPFVHILQVSCICHTVLTSAGAFERSEIQEWPLDGVSGLRCSAGPSVVRDVCVHYRFCCNVRVGATLLAWH